MAEAQWEDAYVTDDLALDLVRTIRRFSSPLEPRPTLRDPRFTVDQSIRAVLFDIYGTLFVSSSGDIDALHAESDTDMSGAFARKAPICRALLESGCTVLDPGAVDEVAETEYEEAIRSIHAEKRRLGVQYPEVDIVQVWEQVLGELNGSGLIMVPDLPGVPYRVAVSYECLSNPVWPMPDCESLLDAAARSGIPMGLVSNAQFYTPLLFSAFFDRTLGELGFNDRLCSFSFRRGEAKPSVHLYEGVRELLFRQLAIAPEEVLYVGNDMLNDIWPAHEAGFSTCLFAGDERSLRLREDHPLCTRLVPDHTVTGLEQVARILDLQLTTAKEL